MAVPHQLRINRRLHHKIGPTYYRIRKTSSQAVMSGRSPRKWVSRPLGSSPLGLISIDEKRELIGAPSCPLNFGAFLGRNQFEKSSMTVRNQLNFFALSNRSCGFPNRKSASKVRQNHPGNSPEPVWSQCRLSGYKSFPGKR